MKGVAAALLAFEAIVALLAGLLAVTASDVATGAAWAAAAGVAVLCVVGAGSMRRGQRGWIIGWVVQVLMIASGFAVGAMFVLGVIFALLWGMAQVLDGRMHASAAP